jgi:hypothetical protein
MKHLFTDEPLGGSSAVVGAVLAAVWAAVSFLAGSVKTALNYLDSRHRGIGIRIGTVRNMPIYWYAYISSYAWGVGG